MSTKELTPQERNITIAVIVLSLLALLAFIGFKKFNWFHTFFDKESNTELVAINLDKPDTFSSDSKHLSEIENLKARLEASEHTNNKLSQQLNSRQAIVVNDSTSSTAIAPVAATALAAVVVSNSEVDGSLLESKIDNLKTQLTSEQSMAQELNKTIRELEAGKAESETSITALSEEITKLKESGAGSNSELQNVKGRLKGLRDSNSKLSADLDALKSSSLIQEKNQDGVITSLQQKLKAAKTSLGGFRANAAFASSANELSEPSKNLYNKLKQINTSNAAEQVAHYATIKSNLNATLMTRVKFGTGKMDVNEASKAKIDTVINSLKANDEILVVGYASMQGNKATNEKLSSKRATAVTKEVFSSLEGDNKLQALYLGETSRFGSLLENQCVEVWQINK